MRLLFLLGLLLVLSAFVSAATDPFTLPDIPTLITLGFHGPVKTVEETTRDCRLVDGEWVPAEQPAVTLMTEFDTAGHLLKQSGHDKNGTSEMTYQFDDRGRITGFSHRSTGPIYPGPVGAGGSSGPSMTFLYEGDQLATVIWLTPKFNVPYVGAGATNTALRIIRYFYDDAGRKIEQQVMDEQHRIESSTRWQYDDAGRIIEQQVMGEQHRIESTTRWQYDAQGREFAVVTRDGKGNETARTSTDYAPDGTTTITSVLPGDEGKAAVRIIEHVDVAGRQLERSEQRTDYGGWEVEIHKETSYSTNGSEVRQEETRRLREQVMHELSLQSYGAKGEILQIAEYDARGLRQQYSTAYNTAGDVVLSSRIYPQLQENGSVHRTFSLILYSYVYDARGNWIRMTSIEPVLDNTGNPMPEHGALRQKCTQVAREITYQQ